MQPPILPVFDGTTPEAPLGHQNVNTQQNSGNPVNRVSFNVPSTGGAVVKTASYSAAAVDCGLILSFEASSAVTYTLANPPPFPKWCVFVQNSGTAALSISPNGLQLNGSTASVSLPTGTGAYISTDGTNYKAVDGIGYATIQGVQQESYIYGPDTGTANAYALTQTPTPTIVAGSIAVLKVAHTNTGASTLSVNGGAATAIKEKDGVTPLAAGDWTAGQIVEVIFDGTNWQWLAGGGGGTSNMPPVGFIMNSGVAGTNVGPMLVSPRAGTVSQCKVVTKASDGTTDLTFKIKKNGTDVFSTDPTVAHATGSGTVSTFATLTSTPLTIAADDVFQIDITSGSASWAFTAQLE